MALLATPMGRTGKSQAARNQLGTLGGVKSFLRGPHFLNYALCPTNFSRGYEKIQGGLSHPVVTGLISNMP